MSTAGAAGAEQTQEPTPATPDLASQASFVFLFLVMAWLPLNVEWRISDMGVTTPDLQQLVSIFFFDVPAIALALVTLVSAGRVRLPGQRRAIPALVGLLLVLVALSWVVHPSARGLQTTLRLSEAVLLGVVLRGMPGGFNIQAIAGGFVVVACLEAALGVTQVARGEVVGLTGLGEHPPLTVFGESISAKGTFVHHYIFGAFLLVAAGVAVSTFVRTGKRAWLMPLPLLGLAFGYTYSRTGALALGAAAVVMIVHAFRGRRVLALGAVALLAGLGVTLATSSDGWRQRIEQTVGTSPDNGGDEGDELSRLDQVTTERILLTRQALEMVADQPVVGIGAGLYSFALAEQLGEPADSAIEFKPVHNVPLLIAAESGIPAGLAATALLVLLGVAAVRAGVEGQVLFVVYLPFVLFDHFPYDAPMGLALTGLWAGGILWLHDQSETDAETT